MAAASTRVIVIGAGIVGAACADALAEGGIEVTLVEAQGVGGGTTAAAMGHLVVMDDSDAQFALTSFSARLWDALVPVLPPTCETEPAGTIWVAVDGDELGALRRKQAFYRDRGVAAELIEPGRLALLEPNLRAGLTGGLLVPGDRVVYPPAVARFLVERAESRGARLRFGSAVTAIEHRRVRLADGEALEADWVVNAAGLGVPGLTPGLDIRPRKGHLVITDRYPGFVRHQLVELGYLKSAHSVTADSVAFNVQPRATGQVLIGSSRQYGNTDPGVEPGLLGRMIRRAIEYMPGLARLSATRVWTGFRPATPDKLPLIGPMPGHDGLLIAAGHERLGIATSLGTARLLTDCVLGRTPSIPLDPYRPARQPQGGHLA